MINAEQMREMSRESAMSRATAEAEALVSNMADLAARYGYRCYNTTDKISQGALGILIEAGYTVEQEEEPNITETLISW